MSLWHSFFAKSMSTFGLMSDPPVYPELWVVRRCGIESWGRDKSCTLPRLTGSQIRKSSMRCEIIQSPKGKIFEKRLGVAPDMVYLFCSRATPTDLLRAKRNRINRFGNVRASVEGCSGILGFHQVSHLPYVIRYMYLFSNTRTSDMEFSTRQIAGNSGNSFNFVSTRYSLKFRRFCGGFR